jgi:TPP-dependent pyruvate/acetoin dehydrogenase alpha subunit/predicted nucleotidyltransferase
MDATMEEKIAEMVRRIVEAVDPDKIILFGSHARGHAGPDSDVDLLIIGPTDSPAYKRTGMLYHALRGMGVPKDLVWCTPDEADERRGGTNDVVARALREGRTLYDREAPYPMHPNREYVPPDQLRDLLRLMLSIRRFEEVASERYFASWKAGQFMGALHTYVGEEAIAVGACTCLRPDDYVVSTHRGHGHCLAKGADLGKMMAELSGRATGYSRGYGGSMHIFAPELGLLGGNGIVGGGLPLAAGAAFTAQYTGTDRVAVCFFGDGASKQGTFHEAFNLCALWDLPAIYVCENNCYAATTPTADSCPLVDIAELAHGYGCPGVVVDGNDVLAVHEAVGGAVANARKGGGPTLIEAKTYRMKPHCMVIRETREQCELEEWEARCPINRFEAYLQAEGLLTADEIAAVHEEVDQSLAAAARFAEESPWPDPAKVLDVLWA